MPRNKKEVKPSKDLGKHAGRVAGKHINDAVDKVGGKAKAGLNKVVDYAGGKAKKYGVDKNLVDHGMKWAREHGGRLIREGTGKAKKWIHTEGRQIVKEGGKKIVDAGRELGHKAKRKWDEFTDRIKRRK